MLPAWIVILLVCSVSVFGVAVGLAIAVYTTTNSSWIASRLHNYTTTTPTTDSEARAILSPEQHDSPHAAVLQVSRLRDSLATYNVLPRMYIHLCTLGGWVDVLSHLVHECERYQFPGPVTVCWVGAAQHRNRVHELIPDNWTVVYKGEDVSRAERVTLEHLHDECTVSDHMFPVLYLHSKGISRVGSQPVKDWTDFMLYYMFQVSLCTYALCDLQFQTVGVDYRDRPSPHYSGNFWWARSDYIKSLPRSCQEDNYHAPEFWLCQRVQKALCLYESHVHHYRQEYPLDMYEGKVELREYSVGNRHITV